MRSSVRPPRTTATISKIENGKTVEVKLSTIEAISNALDINWIKLIS